jgi:hypothetical protein
MAGSNIPDIASDPEKGILKVTLYFLATIFLHLFSFPFPFCLFYDLVYGDVYSFRRSFGWTWMMRPAYTFSRIL